MIVSGQPYDEKKAFAITVARRLHLPKSIIADKVRGKGRYKRVPAGRERRRPDHGEPLWLRVRAENGHGNSPWSQPVPVRAN